MLAAAVSLGILALVVNGFLDPVPYEKAAETAGTTPELVLLGSVVPVFFLMAVAILVGLWTAPKLGFDSHLVSRVTDGAPLFPAVRKDLKPALVAGGAVGVMLLLAETVQPELPERTFEMSVERLLIRLPAGVFFGGIWEELVLRWGMVSLLANYKLSVYEERMWNRTIRSV